MMLGRELRLPDQLQHQPPPEDSSPRHEFVVEMKERLEQAHETLRQQQMKIRQDDQEEPLLFAQGDLVWLQNRRRKKGESNKLQQKFVEPTTEAAAEPEPPATEPEAEPAVAIEPRVATPEPAPPVAAGRPSRVTKKPIRFGDYECYPCETAK